MKIWIVITRSWCEGTDFPPSFDAQAFKTRRAAQQFEIDYLSAPGYDGFLRTTNIVHREVF